MNRHHILFLAVLLGFFQFSSSARAGVLVNESFNYSAGVLGGANGGTGFSGPWAIDSAYNVVSGNLAVPGFQGTGNEVQFFTNFFNRARIRDP